LRRVLTTAGVEVFWRTVVLIKNALWRGEYSALKREEAVVVLGLIFKTLLQDKFGTGTVP
jgi:hypothetical protein